MFSVNITNRSLILLIPLYKRRNTEITVGKIGTVWKIPHVHIIFSACRNMSIDISYIKVPHLLIYVDILLRIFDSWKKIYPFQWHVCIYIYVYLYEGSFPRKVWSDSKQQIVEMYVHLHIPSSFDNSLFNQNQYYVIFTSTCIMYVWRHG